MFRKKKVSDVSFIGKRSGDNECFCWDVSEEEYRKAVGEARYQRDLELESEMYKDCIDLSTDEFYQKLVTSNVHPSTSAPPPGLFVELFTKLSKKTNEILAIMASTKISAVCESAIQAKAMMESGCNIEVIDSEQLIGAQTILVFEALDAAKNGANLKQITDLINSEIPKIHSRMVFDTLEYLKKGGRIGKAQALLGGLLKIHPILGLKDGEVAPFGRARSRGGRAPS